MIWETVLIGVHFLIAAALIGFILMQHGKGADMGAAFGSGASGSLFGAAGSANFLSRTTAILATVFFLSSLGLTYLATNHEAARDLMQQGVAPKAPPAAPKAGDLPQPAAPTSPAPADSSSKAGEVPK
jgi:preprotein translocase subunit SecG